MLVFFSSFGQTFVVSLYIPWFLEEFDISRSFFSGMYAVATLGSAATIIFVGKKIDHVPLKNFTLFVVFGIMLACLTAAFSMHLFMLFIAIYLLRFFGQGLLGHTAMTTMARYFRKARGKALSVAYLGFPLGEALFPVLVISLILAVGWRQTFGLSAVFILLVLLPLSIYLMKGFSASTVVEEYEAPPEKPGREEEQPAWRQSKIIANPWFYLFAPTVFLVGFLQTALFFFQTFIAEYKGWAMEWMAGSITAYALASFSCAILAGPLIDKLSARRLFPFTLLPLGAGVLVLSLSNHPAIAPLYWLLVGITGGMNGPVVSALYAEVYGTRSLGAVRSIFTFVMVVSTALGPVVYSFFLERGFTFDHIHLAVVAVLLLNMIYILVLGRKLWQKTSTGKS